MENRITVFMSTYNGEKYLRQQIDSILNQKNVSLALYIRDDGSMDGTLMILEEYQNNYDNVHVVSGKPVGVGRSFMSLVYGKLSESSYYAFADQDDVWDEDKLISGIEKIRESVKSGKAERQARMYVCNQRCVDGEKNYITDRFPDGFPVQKLQNLLFLNLYAGCTMVFNQEFYHILCDEKRRPELDFFDHRIHDAWTVCVASMIHPIIYDKACHMDFRRHGFNVSDAEVTRYRRTKIAVKWKLCFRRIKRMLNHRNKKVNGVEFTAYYLLKGYSDYMNDEDEKLLRLVSSYRKSFRNKLRLLSSRYLKQAAPERAAGLYIKTIMNIL